MSKNSRLKASSDSRTASGYRSPPSPKGKVYEVFRSEYYLPLWEGFNPICLPQRGRWIEEKWQALRRETDEERDHRKNPMGSPHPPPAAVPLPRRGRLAEFPTPNVVCRDGKACEVHTKVISPDENIAPFTFPSGEGGSRRSGRHFDERRMRRAHICKYPIR